MTRSFTFFRPLSNVSLSVFSDHPLWKAHCPKSWPWALLISLLISPPCRHLIYFCFLKNRCEFHGNKCLLVHRYLPGMWSALTTTCSMNKLGTWGKWRTLKCGHRNLCDNKRDQSLWTTGRVLPRSEATARSPGICRCIQMETSLPTGPETTPVSLTNTACKKQSEWQVLLCFRNVLVIRRFTDLFIFIWQRKAHFDIRLHSPQKVWIYGVS